MFSNTYPAKKLFLKILVIAFLFLIVFTLNINNVGLTNIDDKIKSSQRAKNEVHELILEIQAKLRENEVYQREVFDKIKLIIYDMEALAKEIDGLTDSIEKTEAEIDVKIKELKIAEEKLSNKQEQLNSRLRVMYKSGTVGYLEVLLGADSLHELLSRADTLQAILSHDQNLIFELKEYRADREKKKTQLEDKKEMLTVLFKQKVKRQNELKVAKQELEDYAYSLSQKKAELDVEIEEKRGEFEELEKQIKALELSQKQYIGGRMEWPVPGHFYISSPYGYRPPPLPGLSDFHDGIDIPANEGIPVVAAQSGKVVVSDYFDYGMTIVIDHGGGVTTLYGHLSRLGVKVSDIVSKGEQIGLVGNTGWSTGPHLHFGVYENGKHINPMEYLKE